MISDGRLWEWVGVDQYGDSRTYQSCAPDCVTESGALEFLRGGFPNLKIISIKEVFEPKPSTGPVQTHTYHYGILDDVRRELGLKVQKPVRPVVQPFELYKEGQRRKIANTPIAIQQYLIKR